MSGTGDGVIPTGPSGNGNPNASDNSDDTTLIIGVAAAIGALFLLVLILFVLFVLYYYKKGDPNLNADEEIYHSSRATSRAGSRAGSRRGSRAGSLAGSLSRRGSIIRSTSLRNSFHSDRVFLPNNGWGSTNKGFSDTYEDLDRELWKQSKPDQGTVTHNPLAAFGKDDDFNPIDVNLEGFDKDYKGGLAAEEDVDSGMAETVDETNNDNSKDSNNESRQIQILDMTTWSSPPSSPIRMSQPTPFTVSAQVASSQGDLNSDRGDEYTVDFARANPLNNSASVSDLNRSSMKNRNQSVVDFYENANPRILGYSMDFPSDAYGTGRRLLWQKKHFDNK